MLFLIIISFITGETKEKNSPDLILKVSGSFFGSHNDLRNLIFCLLLDKSNTNLIL